MSMLSSSIYANLPAICGAEDPDTSGTPVNDPNDGSTASQGGEGNQGNGNADGGDPQKKIQAQEEIIARLASQRDDAATQLEELKAYKEEQEAAKLSDEEKRVKEMEQVTAERDELRSIVNTQAIEMAFLRNNDVTWHNPERALALVDLSKVEVDEKTGKVKNPDAIKAAIKNLADSDSYLVKQAEAPDPKDLPGSGTPPKGKPSDAKAQRERLQQKYPALRR